MLSCSYPATSPLTLPSLLLMSTTLVILGPSWDHLYPWWLSVARILKSITLPSLTNTPTVGTNVRLSSSKVRWIAALYFQTSRYSILDHPFHRPKILLHVRLLRPKSVWSRHRPKDLDSSCSAPRYIALCILLDQIRRIRPLSIFFLDYIWIQHYIISLCFFH